MALFPVSRYLGPEAPKSEKAVSILHQLHINAEGRRKKQLENREKDGKNNEEEEVPKLENRKKLRTKSRKSEQKADDDDEKTEETKKRKRKSAQRVDEKSEGIKKQKMEEVKPTPNSDQTILSRTQIRNKKKREERRLQKEVQSTAIEGEQEGEIPEEDNTFPVIGQDMSLEISKVSRVLPDWLANPTVVPIDLQDQQVCVSDLPGLDPFLIALLKKNGVAHFFPVQISVIPWFLNSIEENVLRPNDLCISAPTGSGKTFVYVLPIIQVLRQRIVCSIRALIVLPVRNLAVQVYKVFETYCEKSGLKVGLAIGQNIFEIEQASLVRKGYREYHSLVDILICTPGRLVDHINQTPGFSLKDLRFLVIDEADRIMQQIKQGWLIQVENCVGQQNLPLVVNRMEELRRMPQKILLSATLSHDPEKLQQLHLFQPKLFTSVVSEVNNVKDAENAAAVESGKSEFIGKYTTPKELSESYIMCTNSTKPLVLLHLIHNLKYRKVLCFTNSLESSHRLYLLLSAFGDVKIEEFSSKLHARKREAILKKFSQGSVDVIVCSDAMARGMDIENVQYVISYDSPQFLKTYIHRVGRTARAGRFGTAITLLQSVEFKEFQSKMHVARKSQVNEIKVEDSDLEKLEEPYRAALERTAGIVARESKLRKK